MGPQALLAFALAIFLGADFSAGGYLSLAAAIVAVEIMVAVGHVWFAGRARRLLRTPRIVKSSVNRRAGTVLACARVAIIAMHRGS